MRMVVYIWCQRIRTRIAHDIMTHSAKYVYMQVLSNAAQPAHSPSFPWSNQVDGGHNEVPHSNSVFESRTAAPSRIVIRLRVCRYNPSKRPTCSQCLQYPFFKVGVQLTAANTNAAPKPKPTTTTTSKPKTNSVRALTAFNCTHTSFQVLRQLCPFLIHNAQTELCSDRLFHPVQRQRGLQLYSGND